MRAQGPATAGIYPPIAAAGARRSPRRLPASPKSMSSTPFEFRYEGTRATFGAGNMDIVRRRRSLRFLSGDANDILASLPDRDRAIVTEPFADKHHVHVGRRPATFRSAHAPSRSPSPASTTTIRAIAASSWSTAPRC